MRTSHLFFINSLVLPIIPLLFLFNQNSRYLYFPIIVVTGVVLVLMVAIFYGIINFLYKSEGIAFIACLIFVVLLFALDSIYDLYDSYGQSPIYFFMLTPLISYIVTYLVYKVFRRIPKNASVLFLFFLIILLGMNIYPLGYNLKTFNENNIEFKYKVNFTIDSQIHSPNVYWFLCDGMLGFSSMEKYFHDPQEELKEGLKKRGFTINEDAMLETAHDTRIAIPTLMSPEYYDKNLANILSNHEDAMKLRKGSDNDLYNSRVYNETINAFDSKGYNTVSISIKDIYFLPTTDFFYFINSSDTNRREYINKPYYIKNDYIDYENEKLRLFSYQFGDIFLGGLPGIIFDKVYSSDENELYDLSTTYDFTSDILLGYRDHEVYTTLVESLYDTLNSSYIDEPKFVLTHYMMAHRPFEYNEIGEKVIDSENIKSYRGHHTYSTKVLMNLVDMVLKEDPNAVIILQADHGLHGQTEAQIIDAFGDYNAALDIWNNVFSAIRVPEQYQNGQEQYAIEEPHNISRYIVNNFVGINYEYIVNEKEFLD